MYDVRCGTWFRRVSIMRRPTTMVVILWRAKLRPIESYKRSFISDTRGPVPGAVGPHRSARCGASWWRRGKPRMLGAIRQHYFGNAGTEHDGSSRALGGIRDEDAAAIDPGESRQSAKGGDSMELAVDQEAVHHDVLRSENSCHSILGRQQLAGNARSAGGWLSRDPVACGRVVSGLRLRQVAGERRSRVWRVSYLANCLQSSSVERLSAAAAASGARW